MKNKKNRLAKGTKERPRLSVYRSNQNIYAQIIDDVAGVTLVSSSSIKFDSGQNNEAAVKVGQSIAEAAKKKKIEMVIFDRGVRQYKGKIKSLAEAARNTGLHF
jgi:large subunit ribosomal protein L18